MYYDRKSESDDVIRDCTPTGTPSAVVLLDDRVDSLHRDQKKNAADKVVDVNDALKNQDNQGHPAKIRAKRQVILTRIDEQRIIQVVSVCTRVGKDQNHC